MTDLVVDFCSYHAAKYAVEQWHYSHVIPKGRNNYLGIWEGDKFIGAIVFGFSNSPSLGMAFGLTQHEYSELRRIALNNHDSYVSQIMKRAIRLVKNKNNGLRLLISYADTRQSHHGGIYQATNWIYIGEAGMKREVKIAGVWRNDTHAFREKKHLITDSRLIPPKHKYIYPLDKAMRRQVSKLAQPYPKREDMRAIDGNNLVSNQARRFDPDPSALKGRD
jgi:hypothetical protein